MSLSAVRIIRIGSPPRLATGREKRNQGGLSCNALFLYFYYCTLTTGERQRTPETTVWLFSFSSKGVIVAESVLTHTVIESSIFDPYCNGLNLYQREASHAHVNRDALHTFINTDAYVKRIYIYKNIPWPSIAGERREGGKENDIADAFNDAAGFNKERVGKNQS